MFFRPIKNDRFFYFMNMESLRFLALLFAPFAIAFLIEATVIYFFKLKGLWVSIGLSVLINLITLAVIFFGVMALLGKLHYEFNGLHLPLQVVAFLWWFSSIADGFLFRLFLPKAQMGKAFAASIIMNFASYLFLYLFIVNSH